MKTRKGRPLDAAIVGMACRFPGAADLFAFWENILAGKEAISEVPSDRWNGHEFSEPTSAQAARVSCTRGGYLDSPIPFDPAAHGVMPHAVDGAEPEQFLILEAARAALADAGLREGVADGRRVEVLIGRGNYFNRGNLTRLQHGRILAQTVAVARALRPDLSPEALRALRDDLASSLPPFGAETIPGQLTNATAGRVANRLDFRGASFVVDAASASSLVALDLGVRAMAEGRADLAIVGGVYIQSDVDFPMVFSRLGALSRSGRPRPFGRGADGMVPGEGVGVVVLKRRTEAERDGDRIYAVVKGVGFASDGRGLGLASPSARGHALAMRRAYRRARLDPSAVGLIEGHGLGVPAADRAELRAIRAVFPPSRDRVLGSVSSMIGHAMPAAGVAGLIKAALSLYHRALPPTLGADDPHPLLLDHRTPCRLSRATRPWAHDDPASPRVAAVNAFGFAGINAHAVLEEHSASADADGPGCLLRWDTEAILLASPDRAAMIRTMETLAARIDRRPDVKLKDLAFTLNTATHEGGTRLGLVVGSAGELAERLRSLLPRLGDPSCRSIRDGRGTYFRDELAAAPGLAVLFPGEGSQYPGMLGDLCLHFPSVRALFDTSDRVARQSGAAERPSRLLFGEGAAEGMGLWTIGPAVNVVLSSQWALYGLLTRLGVQPDAVVGHSSGELLALAASGAIHFDRSFSDALGRLGAVFEGLESSGELPEASLLAVASGRDRVEEIARGLEVAVAIDNCPHQVVAAGAPGLMEELAARLNDEGILFDPLPFSRGYHTRAFAAVIEPVRRLLEERIVSGPAIPTYSCATTRRMPDDRDGVRELAIDQWSRPVRFRETIERMYGDGYRVFVDVGARGHLAGFVEDILRGRPATAIAMNTPRRSGPTQLNHLVATLFSLGFPLRTESLYARRRPERIDLEAPLPSSPPMPTLRLGFPEMRVSEEMADKLRMTGASLAEGLRPPGGPSRPVEFEVFEESPPFVSVEGLAEGPGFATRPVDRPAFADDEVMLDYLQTMDRFLATQRDVMSEYFGPAGSSDPRRLAPWAGEIQAIEEGREVVTVYRLDAPGDPVAAHHTLGGRRVSALDPDRLGLPVLPFAVMAEMLAQVAAILEPEGVLIALRDVLAHRWIRYEEGPIALEIEARRDSDRPGEVRVTIHNRGPFDAMRPREAPVVEGVAVFGMQRPSPLVAEPFELPGAVPSKFTAARLYGEQWLFHGPALQGLRRVGGVADSGIEGTLRVLPRGALLREPGDAPLLHTDPIVLDNFTHLLGCWGLDRLDGGDVVFPLRMGELALFGDDPAEGTDVECRVRIRRLERRRVGGEAEIVRPDGTTWMRIEGWEDWRFHWPGRYRDVFRRPDVELLGEELSLGRVGLDSARAVWLQPPDDMGRPVWRDVLEQTQLAPEERLEIAAGPDARRTARLWGRIAAKDAARRLWLDRGRPPIFPADLAIMPDRHGRPLLDAGPDETASISIAHAEGVAVALATLDPSARPGIDVERIVPRAIGFEAIAFLPAERRLIGLAARGGDRDEWIARFWCAKESVAKCTGLGLIDGSGSVEVVGLGPGPGALLVRLGPTLASALPGPIGGPIRVDSARRGEYAWAWTLGEGSEGA